LLFLAKKKRVADPLDSCWAIIPMSRVQVSVYNLLEYVRATAALNGKDGMKDA